MNKLKERWGLTSNFQVFIILLVFSITGSLSLKVGRLVLDYFGVIHGEMSAILYWPLRILSVFIMYQILLVTIGTIFGQHKFFWAMEKKMLSRLGFKRWQNDKV